MKTRFKVAIAVLALIGAAIYWLFWDNRPGNIAAMPLDVAALRIAADSMPGDKPLSISAERVAAGEPPSALLVAGGGLGKVRQGVHAFSVNFADAPVLIDTGFNEGLSKALKLYAFKVDAQARVNAALARAKAIIVTHEHLDHIGGLLVHPDWNAVQAKALITKEQFDHPEVSVPAQWPRGSRAKFKPHIYSGIKAIAPGVVVMKAPSHTPGSQIVFVKLADGREYLFMGDISSMDRNWRETRARSRLVADVIVGEDRAAVFGWLKAFKKASELNQGLIMVPTHDAEAVDRLVREGALVKGFQINPS